MLTEAQAPPVWPANASIEQRFVLAISGNQDSRREEQWRALLPQVNWPQLLESTHPDMYPYLHYCLQVRAPAGSCPPEVLGHLAARRQLTAVRNLRMISELRSIQAALTEQEIPILALKGIALVISVYPDASLRPMWPSLFVTDISSNPSSKAVDWQQGGQPISPGAVFGTWKAAVRTVDNPPLQSGEYRWDGVGGTFFFIDPKDDMFTIVMMESPSQRGRIQRGGARGHVAGRPAAASCPAEHCRRPPRASRTGAGGRRQ